MVFYENWRVACRVVSRRVACQCWCNIGRKSQPTHHYRCLLTACKWMVLCALHTLLSGVGYFIRVAWPSQPPPPALRTSSPNIMLHPPPDTGEFRTYRRVAATLYWKGMMRHAEDYVAAYSILLTLQVRSDIFARFYLHVPCEGEYWRWRWLDPDTGFLDSRISSKWPARHMSLDFISSWPLLIATWVTCL